VLVIVITNYGSQSISNVGVTISVPGLPSIPTQIIPIIGPSETKLVKINLPVENLESLTVSVGLNIAVLDSNPKNNILTKNLKLKGAAKIIGRVVDKNTKKSISDAIVEYIGPCSGKEKTNPAGQYKIEKLKFGEYTLSASAEGYEKSEPIDVEIKKKAITNIDFYLERLEKIEKEERKLSVEECWEELKLMITDKKIINELKGYVVYQVEVIPAGNINQIIKQLKTGELKIIECIIETE